MLRCPPTLLPSLTGPGVACPQRLSLGPIRNSCNEQVIACAIGKLLRIFSMISLSTHSIKPLVRNVLKIYCTTKRNLACLEIQVNLILRIMSLTIFPFTEAQGQTRNSVAGASHRQFAHLSSHS